MGILNYIIIFLLVIFPIAEIGKIRFGSITFSLNDILLFSVFLLWIVIDYKKIKKTKFKLLKPISIFILIGVFSLVVNFLNLKLNEFFVALLYLLRWVLYASFYFILVTRDKEFLNKIKHLLLIPISIVLSLGILQFIYYPSLRNLFYLGWDEHLYRLFSSFLDPNFAGTFLVISLFYLIYTSWQLFLKKKNNLFVFTSALTIINFVSIYLTYSRSALIMLLVSLIVFLLLVKKIKILFILILVFILLILFSPKAFQTEGTNIFRVFSSQERVKSAQIAVNIIEKSLIFGVGFNAYRYAQNKYANLNDTNWETTHSGAGTDNSFLFVLATTGILGFAAYLYLIYKMFLLGKEKLNNPMSIILISVLSGLLINSLFINSLFYVFILQWVWMFAAFTENN
ncbi:MAG: O-antigen ligase family protein [Patescibacteria group bacterium]